MREAVRTRRSNGGAWWRMGPRIYKTPPCSVGRVGSSKPERPPGGRVPRRDRWAGSREARAFEAKEMAQAAPGCRPPSSARRHPPYKSAPECGTRTQQWRDAILRHRHGPLAEHMESRQQVQLEFHKAGAALWSMVDTRGGDGAAEDMADLFITQ